MFLFAKNRILNPIHDIVHFFPPVRLDTVEGVQLALHADLNKNNIHVVELFTRPGQGEVIIKQF